MIISVGHRCCATQVSLILNSSQYLTFVRSDFVGQIAEGGLGPKMDFVMIFILVPTSSEFTSSCELVFSHEHQFVNNINATFSKTSSYQGDLHLK